MNGTARGRVVVRFPRARGARRLCAAASGLAAVWTSSGRAASVQRTTTAAAASRVTSSCWPRTMASKPVLVSESSAGSGEGVSVSVSMMVVEPVSVGSIGRVAWVSSGVAVQPNAIQIMAALLCS